MVILHLLHIDLNCVQWGSGSLCGFTPYPLELYAISLLMYNGVAVISSDLLQIHPNPV